MSGVTRIGSVVVETTDRALALRVAQAAASVLEHRGFMRTEGVAVRWASAWHYDEHGFGSSESGAAAGNQEQG